MPGFKLYNTDISIICKVSSSSDVVATQTVCDFGFTPKVWHYHFAKLTWYSNEYKTTQHGQHWVQRVCR